MHSDFLIEGQKCTHTPSIYPGPKGEERGLPVQGLGIGVMREGVKQKCQKEPGKGTWCQERPLAPNGASGATS